MSYLDSLLESLEEDLKNGIISKKDYDRILKKFEEEKP